MSFEIKELTDLVEEEKKAQERFVKAQQEAEKIKDDAKKRADGIVENARFGTYLEDMVAKKRKEIEGKKAELEKKFDKDVNDLKEKAGKKLEDAVSRVIDEVMRVEL